MNFGAAVSSSRFTLIANGAIRVFGKMGETVMLIPLRIKVLLFRTFVTLATPLAVSPRSLWTASYR